jgi:hypothetical protein
MLSSYDGAINEGSPVKQGSKGNTSRRGAIAAALEDAVAVVCNTLAAPDGLSRSVVTEEHATVRHLLWVLETALTDGLRRSTFWRAQASLWEVLNAVADLPPATPRGTSASAASSAARPWRSAIRATCPDVRTAMGKSRAAIREALNQGQLLPLVDCIIDELHRTGRLLDFYDDNALLGSTAAAQSVLSSLRALSGVPFYFVVNSPCMDLDFHMSWPARRSLAKDASDERLLSLQVSTKDCALLTLLTLAPLQRCGAVTAAVVALAGGAAAGNSGTDSFALTGAEGVAGFSVDEVRLGLGLTWLFYVQAADGMNVRLLADHRSPRLGGIKYQQRIQCAARCGEWLRVVNFPCQVRADGPYCH